MKIVQVFTEIHMSAQHKGLKDIALRHKVNLDKLDSGSIAIFINKAKDKIKCYSPNGVLSYMRSIDKNRPFDISAIQEFPRAFDANGKFSYDAALKLRLEKILTKKPRPN